MTIFVRRQPKRCSMTYWGMTATTKITAKITATTTSTAADPQVPFP
jgi:hypothetical protein